MHKVLNTFIVSHFGNDTGLDYSRGCLPWVIRVFPRDYNVGGGYKPGEPIRMHESVTLTQ
jgi:hypothetical protein